MEEIELLTPDMTPEQIKENWDVHFNNLTYRDGVWKVVARGQEPKRFHDKKDAEVAFNSINSNALLITGDRISMVK